MKMALRKSKVYKLIASGTKQALVKGMLEYLKSGKNPNLRDPATGGNLLHHIVGHAERFREPETLVIVYMLACKDVEIDAQDNYGDTSLHKAVRIKGAHRLIITLIRCGADTALVNNEGHTAEDILVKQKPDGWQNNLHHYNKFKPGLWQALQVDEPDRKLVERLLKSWCRTVSVKNEKVIDFKTALKDDIRKLDLIQLLEKYENTIELALAVIGGVGFIVQMWVKQGILTNFDPDGADIAYEQNYPETVMVPQPLLAATWETNDFGATDVLMDLKANPNILYSPNPPTVPLKPLYFNILDSEYKPTEQRVTERIFKDCDFSLRNSEGQTILFELIKHNESESLVKFVLNKNINIACRDRLGRTARDYADANGRLVHSRLIDEYVIKVIKNKQIQIVEKLIIENYNHLHDIKDNSGRSAVEIAKKYANRQMMDLVKLSEEVQKYVRRMFQSVEEGVLDDLKKLLSCRKYAAAKDTCGKTVLLFSILRKNKDMVLYLIQEHDFIINVCDNLGRSALHYTYLFLDDPEVIDELEKHGADTELMDVRGVKPISYSRKICGNQGYVNLVKEVEALHLDIYVHETQFDIQFHSAIENGDFDSVENLITELKQHGDVSRYSNVLFDCLEESKEDIAVFLIMSGCKMNIYKQFNQCDPSNPMCAMMECGHGMTSLRERANQMNCKRVIQLMDDLNTEESMSPEKHVTRL